MQPIELYFVFRAEIFTLIMIQLLLVLIFLTILALIELSFFLHLYPRLCPTLLFLPLRIPSQNLCTIMGKKSRSSKPTEAMETSEWVVTGLLDSKDNNASSMKVNKLDEVRLLFDDNVDAVVPDATIGADCFRKGWVCFYYYPFEIGIRFPFSRLVVDVLTALDVSPGQLMPSSWRILACLDAIEEKHKLGINLDVVRHCYATKKFNGCRCGLVSKNKDEPLILSLEVVNDRGWKNDFFFIEKANLGDGGLFLHERWNAKDYALGSEENESVALSIVNKIFDLPDIDRTWPNCLNRPIRNATPKTIDTHSERGSKAVVRYDASLAEKSVPKSAAARTRSKRALSVSGIKVGGGHTGSPSKSVHSVSSESEDDPKADSKFELSVGRQIAKEFKSPCLQVVSFSSKDLFAKRCRDDKSTETESSKATILGSPGAKRMKLLEEPSANIGKKSFSQIIPASKHGVNVRSSSFASSLKSLLLPQTVEAHSGKDANVLIGDTVGDIYESFQSALMLQEAYAAEIKQRVDLEVDYAHVVEQLKELKSEHGGCIERIRTLQEKADKSSKTLKEVQTEFDEFAEKVKEINDKYAAETKEVIIEHIMRTRAEMMLEYKRGEWALWDADETIKEYNGKYPTRALLLNFDDESEHQTSKDIAQDDIRDVVQEAAQNAAQDDIPGEAQEHAPNDE